MQETPIRRRGNTLIGIQKILRRTADLACQTHFPAACQEFPARRRGTRMPSSRPAGGFLFAAECPKVVRLERELLPSRR